MAKAESKVNKSQVIRDILADDPKADYKTVVERAAEKGAKVSQTMVYYVRSKLGQAARKAKRAQSAANTRNPVELIARVKRLANEVGGMKQLKQLVDLLAE
jgi:DNA repair photolyase